MRAERTVRPTTFDFEYTLHIGETVMMDLVDGLHLQIERYEEDIAWHKAGKCHHDGTANGPGKYGCVEDLMFLYDRLGELNSTLFTLADEADVSIDKQIPAHKVVRSDDEAATTPQKTTENVELTCLVCGRSVPCAQPKCGWCCTPRRATDPKDLCDYHHSEYAAT